jgi:hypothetical protein
VVKRFIYAALNIHIFLYQTGEDIASYFLQAGANISRFQLDKGPVRPAGNFKSGCLFNVIKGLISLLLAHLISLSFLQIAGHHL